MPTRRFDANKEQSLALISAGNAGNGNDSHCPNGKSSYDGSITFRTLLRFAHDWSGMTRVTKVELFMRLTSGTHTAQGGSRRAKVNRCGDTGSWSAGGGAENSWSTTASGTRYPGPAAGTTSEGSMSGTGWQSVDITASYWGMVPSYIAIAAGAGGFGGSETNNGVRIGSDDEGLSSHSFEFSGMSSSYPPYVLVTYESNTPPDKPVLTAPANGATLAPGAALLLSWTGSDADATDALLRFDLQFGASAAFSPAIYNGVGLSPGAAQVGPWVISNYPYAGPALPVGTPLYWRVRNQDESDDYGPWSDARTVTLGVVPTISGASPSASLADIWNLDTDAAIWTSAGAHAKPIVQWVYQHAGAKQMAAYRVRLYTDALAQVYDSGTVAASAVPGATVKVNVPFAVVNGTAMRWGVEVRDADGNWSAAMAPVQFKVRWGQAVYTQNVGAGASGLQHTMGTLTNGRAGIMFRTATDAAGAGASAWVNSLSSIDPVLAYIHVMVRLVALVSGSNPALPDMSLTYAGTVALPDKWLVSGAGTQQLDKTIRRFGKYSVRLRATATTPVYLYPFRQLSTDGVVVQQDTDYTFSAYVNTGGIALPGGNVVQLLALTTGGVALSPSPWYPQDAGVVRQTGDTRLFPEGWQRIQGSFHVPSGITALRPAIWLGATPTAGMTVWVDAVKLEPGRVASTWTPGFMSEAGAVDSQGFLIDGSTGGIFRLRGATGGLRDVVELGASGLKFADTELASPSVGVMAANGVPLSLSGHTHAAPATTVVGAATEVAGTAASPAVNGTSELRHGTPGAGEDPNGFHVSATGRLKIPAGMAGLYQYTVQIEGTAPAGTTSGQFAYATANMVNSLPAARNQLMGRWDRFDSGATQGVTCTVVRQFAVGDEWFVQVVPRIVAGLTMRVMSWSLVRLGTAIA